MIFTVFRSIFIQSVICMTVTTAAADINADAKAIADAKMESGVIANIFYTRTPDERQKINAQVANLNKGEGICDKTYLKLITAVDRYGYFVLGHIDQSRGLFCTMLVNEYDMLAYILRRYLISKDETTITMILVLTKNMDKLKEVYKNIEHNFDEDINDQRKPFKNLLNVWTEKSREPDPPGNVNRDEVNKDAKALFDTQSKWDDERHPLEVILIQKSFKYSAAVLAEFERLNQGQGTIEDSIRKNIKNHDLKDAYVSLATFVKNKYQYIASIMTDLKLNEDTSYKSWILCAATTAPQEWPKVDEVYRKANQNKPLINHILERDESHIFVEYTAALVDTSYKPSFLGQPPKPPTPPPAG